LSRIDRPIHWQYPTSGYGSAALRYQKKDQLLINTNFISTNNTDNINKTINITGKLLFPELSYAVNGVLMDVAKQLGGGHKEKYYCNAIEQGLTYRKIKFQREYYIPVQYRNNIVGKYFVDFFIEDKEDKIVLEIKRGKFITPMIISQVKYYLDALDLKLAIVGIFTYKGVILKRILNEY